MAKIQVLISDYDGTFINSKGEISPANLKAVNDFIDRGGKFFIATGRMTKGIEPFLRNIGYKGMFISFNGAEIIDIKTNKKLYGNYMSTDICVRFLKFCEKYDITGVTYPNDDLYVEKTNDFIKSYENACKEKAIVKYPLSEYFIENKLTSAKLLITDDYAKTLPLIDELRSILPECDVIKTTYSLIEINQKGVDKGTAVKRISEMLNVPMSDIIAVGDAENDLPMLQMVGHPITVSNCTPAVREFCEIVGPSNDEDAIKWIIEKYCI